MKIIVAHEGKQHSFMTAEGLYKKGYLYRYITTIYDRPHSFTSLLKSFLGGDYKKKCSSRKTNAIPDDLVIQFCEIEALIRLFISKIPYLNRFIPDYYNWLHDRFGKKVAQYAIKNNVDAVIMYDTNANECWKILKLKAPHIKRILDVSIANRLFMKENFIKDMELTQDTYLMKEKRDLWNNKNIERYKEEIDLTDEFIVASNIVLKSLMFSGAKRENIHICPYGVDSSKFNFIQKQTPSIPLRLLYVGEISYRKGIHHLVNTIKRFLPDDVELFLAGAYKIDSPIYNMCKNQNNIHLLGFVTKDRLAKLYQDCDVFVFPTLGEGYGLVILEALSCGVPCIVSNLAGGDDAINNGYNGFIIKAGDEKDLYDKIQWFIKNPDKLAEMSYNSRNSVLKQDWNSYFKGLTSIIENITKK